MKPISNQTVVRIVKAIDFIEENLHLKLDLNLVAAQASFSPFHFHRLFSVITKETLTNFINRKRIEKAAPLLIYKRNLTITEISYNVGFTSLSSFSRSFKKFYGMSPLEFKKNSPEKYSKICKTESKIGKVELVFEQYVCTINNILNWLQMNGTTTIKEVPQLMVAYVNHQGQLGDIVIAYQKLIKWATPKGLMEQLPLRMITMYHDSVKFSNPNNIRMSACLVLNEPIKDKSEINTKEIAAGKCMVTRLEIIPDEFQKAWEANFVWMTENGYQKSDKDPFEIYYNNAANHLEGKFIVDFCIPVL